jgi:undecaprenyl-phosphate 4-deoxy-4-formamido-L-arabinose transferase
VSINLSIVIPVYNGENTLIPLFTEIQKALDGKLEYEVIFVCDKPIDDSWKKIQYLHINNPEIVIGYNLKKNYGQHKALLFGIKSARGGYILTMDEDMQHDPAYIPAMMNCMKECDLDVVYGKFLEVKKEKVRKIGSDLGRQFAVNLISGLHKDYSPFRIIKAETAQNLVSKKNIVFIDALLANTKAKIGSYTIKHLENRRPSSYSLIKLIHVAFSSLLWYSRKVRYTIMLLIGILISTIIYYTISDIGILAGVSFLTLSFIFIGYILTNSLRLETVRVIETTFKAGT